MTAERAPEDTPESRDSDSDSTSTELCDEPDRLSDVDSNDPSSASDRWSPRAEGSSAVAEVAEELRDGIVAEITDQIGKLSEHDDAPEEVIREEVATWRSGAGGKFELEFVATTPGSAKSFSSGETMGPDSKVSSISASPRTPQEFVQEKSACSSASSESKTLTLRSVDSDKFGERKGATDAGWVEVTSPWTATLSADSLGNKSEVSPKLVVSSSSESCSPGKLKSSER